MGSDLVKGALLFRGEGCATFATDHDDYALREWADASVCRLGEEIALMLRRHVVSTSYERRYGPRTLVVRRAEPIPVAVATECGPEVVLRFLNATGHPVDQTDLLQTAGVRKMWLDYMEDTAGQVARVIRAHLGGSGPCRVRTSFGLSLDGSCLLEMINPLECDFGTSDYDALHGLIGGQII